MVDRTSDRLRVWDVQIDRRGTTNGCNAADELVCSGRPRIQGMVPCRISSSSMSPLANEVYQGPGIGISSRHADADCPVTRRVRLYSPARGSRGGDGDPLSTFRTRVRGKLLCCRVPPMPPGYKTIISVETSPIWAHRTVLAATSPDPGNGTVSHFLIFLVTPREPSIPGAGYRHFLKVRRRGLPQDTSHATS